MKKLLILLVFLIPSLCFSQSTNKIEGEINQWQKELYLNGEVGPPCKEDYYQWMEENPNYYWGRQKISESHFDFNDDGLKDALVYFPAINCVGGNGKDSDFGVLLYSNQGKMLTNKKITSIVEGKIGSTLVNEGISSIFQIIISYNELHERINGDFNAFLDSDAHCCPSISGTFSYDPTDFSIQVDYDQN